MNPNEKNLAEENAALRARLEETEETLRAIRSGEVDALVVNSPGGPQVFILESSDAESNRFRSDILGKVSDAVIAIDDDYRLIYLNAAAESQYGMPASAALGRHLTELFDYRWCDPADEKAAAIALREIGHWRGEHIHIKRCGSVIRVESSISRLQARDGTPSGLLSVMRDITERIAAEETLRASEERYRALFNTIEEGFCVIEMIFDENGKPTDYRFLQTSPSFAEQTGMVDVIGKTILELVPNHENHWFELYGEVARTGKPLRFQNQAQGLDRWFDVCASRFGDPEKHQVAVLFNDITERIKADRILRRNEEMFLKIIEMAPSGVFVMDDQFRVSQVSKPARPVFQAAEPVIGKDFTEVMHILWGESLGNEVAGIFKQTLITGEPYIADSFTEWREDLHMERSYDWETHRLTLPSGNLGVVCFFTDTTERAQAAAALRASEQRANNIIQSISDGFLTMDRDWNITYLSARGAEIISPLQKTADNIIGKLFWDEFPPTVGTVIELKFRRAMAEQMPAQFETFYGPLDRWFDLRVYPSPTGISVYFLDINERKMAEAALRAADRSKDEFLAMLAHELRNPLAPLRNAAEILQMPETTQEIREQSQRLISRQIENMSRMIDDLLDVSRITQGKIVLKKENVDLTSILQTVASVAETTCISNSQQFSFLPSARRIVLNADSTRLEQVFGNLLSNACKYSGDGSKITLSSELRGGEAIIRVSDNGAGIDPNVLPRIFELFVQSSRTLDRAHGGLGIGLTIVHRLVVLHGGTIHANSAGLGKGTEFIVRLPALTEAVPQRTAKPAAKSQKPLRMLIVDDNQDSAESMGMLQKIYGHEVHTAYSGPDAINIAREFHPEVVLLDIGLPGMDGFEVARRLREMPDLADSFLVALTGYGTADDRQRAIRAGFNEHLAKPANLDKLREWLLARNE